MTAYEHTPVARDACGDRNRPLDTVVARWADLRDDFDALLLQSCHFSLQLFLRHGQLTQTIAKEDVHVTKSIHNQHETRQVVHLSSQLRL